MIGRKKGLGSNPAPFSLTPFHYHSIIELAVKRMNSKYLVVSLILSVSFILGAGCDLISGVETEPSALPELPASSENTPINPNWKPEATEGQSQALPSIADVVAKVKPSVVAIAVEIIVFDIFGRQDTQEGGGSGWIISEDGVIVTNNHVVEGAESITVTLDDGRTFPVGMSTIATDPLSDLAVLKINAENLPAAVMGDSSQMKVGAWVVVIGNALGEGISATSGIVSRQRVSITFEAGQILYNLIQTDAAINPGNSGGPLVNIAGEVIGITSAKLAAFGIEGMGYAISSQEAAPIVQNLINAGYVVRPWLGIVAETVNPTLVFWNDLAVDQGAYLRGVALGSPADRAGIEEGDVIVKFEDELTPMVNDLLRAIHSAEIGQEVEITFWRGDSKETTKVILVESPPPES